ncbi:uncharacterized protein LOC135806896 [Sycon ciliatum]|uniref:uncharacterized protein LOC135806896 n=1 Tax=Sycon ciliatum TaxID=27933 RepID=UPI0031F659F6
MTSVSMSRRSSLSIALNSPLATSNSVHHQVPTQRSGYSHPSSQSPYPPFLRMHDAYAHTYGIPTPDVSPQRSYSSSQNGKPILQSQTAPIQCQVPMANPMAGLKSFTGHLHTKQMPREYAVEPIAQVESGPATMISTYNVQACIPMILQPDRPPAACMMSTENMDSLEELQRRQHNREAAKEYRRKKNIYVQGLERRVAFLEERQAMLISEITLLANQIFGQPGTKSASVQQSSASPAQHSLAQPSMQVNKYAVD